MRQRQAVVGHFRHVLVDNAQQVNAVILLAAFSQQLHTEANAQHRLGTGFNQFDQIALAQLVHRRLSRAHSRQKQFIGAQHHIRVAADLRLVAVAAHRGFHRIEVGAAGIEDHHVHQSTPFEDGSVSPWTRIA